MTSNARETVSVITDFETAHPVKFGAIVAALVLLMLRMLALDLIRSDRITGAIKTACTHSMALKLL